MLSVDGWPSCFLLLQAHKFLLGEPFHDLDNTFTCHGSYQAQPLMRHLPYAGSLIVIMFLFHVTILLHSVPGVKLQSIPSPCPKEGTSIHPRLKKDGAFWPVPVTVTVSAVHTVAKTCNYANITHF